MFKGIFLCRATTTERIFNRKYHSTLRPMHLNSEQEIRKFQSSLFAAVRPATFSRFYSFLFCLVQVAILQRFRLVTDHAVTKIGHISDVYGALIIE